MNRYQTLSRCLLEEARRAARRGKAPYWAGQRPLLADHWLEQAARSALESANTGPKVQNRSRFKRQSKPFRR